MERKRFQVDKYNTQKKKVRFITLGLFVALLLLAAVSLVVGQYGISPVRCLRIIFGTEKADDYTVTMLRNIILNIRLPRTLAAVIIGGSLSIAGLTYQCVFRNMLVSQDILGVSTGLCRSCDGDNTNLSVYYIQGLSFAAGMLSVFLVFLLSKTFRVEKHYH